MNMSLTKEIHMRWQLSRPLLLVQSGGIVFYGFYTAYFVMAPDLFAHSLGFKVEKTFHRR
jgi:hypothetical protein